MRPWVRNTLVAATTLGILGVVGGSLLGLQVGGRSTAPLEPINFLLP